jgi:hypothetical protein
MPSCIRAPPAAENRISGRLSFTASSAAAMIALPTYMPMDPPMKLKSCAAATIGVRPISPAATSIASFSPVAFLRGAHAVGIAFLVAELQRVGHRQRHLDLGEDAAVEQRAEAVARRDRHVVAAIGADVQHCR